MSPDEKNMSALFTPEMITQTLSQIVEEVFGTMIGLKVDPSDSPWFPGANRLTAAVHLAGDWNGAVAVECHAEQARRFAGRFLSVEVPPDVDNDVRDVAGELANMIGGNLKSALCHGLRLSVPTIAFQPSHQTPLAEALLRLAFATDDGVFWITVTDY